MLNIQCLYKCLYIVKKDFFYIYVYIQEINRITTLPDHSHLVSLQICKSCRDQLENNQNSDFQINSKIKQTLIALNVREHAKHT